jgi:hypothetical protein
MPCLRNWEFTPATDWRLVAGGRYDSITYNFKNKLTPGRLILAPRNEVQKLCQIQPQVGGDLRAEFCQQCVRQCQSWIHAARGEPAVWQECRA